MTRSTLFATDKLGELCFFVSYSVVFYLVVRVLQQQQPQGLQAVVDPLPPALLHLRLGDLEVEQQQHEKVSSEQMFLTRAGLQV